ncbi:hypothetical protein [Streptomyces sp. ADI91-18]|uniref:tetratricopeptide repeat protein n=1 Tax=Streptomyces sp. ADI91-18 TaxID=1522755 RepID=UPI000F5551F1|nr:hypothetical protein [Streptomyces sp. ADI91-18]
MVLTPPSQRPQPDVRSVLLEAIKTLTEHGIDGQAFVRYGLGPRLADKIAALASLPKLLSLVSQNEAAEEFSRLIDELPAEVLAWSHLCGADAAPKEPVRMSITNPEGEILDGIMEIAHDWHAKVRAWVQEASMQDILDWKCPPDEEFNHLIDYEAGNEEIEVSYGWIVDRLTETYLSDWVEKSLHSEYRWLKGGTPNLFPDTILALRPLGQDALNAEIAERAVMSAGDTIQRETVRQLDIQAAQLVRLGNRRTAVSTYRLILKISPGDASARNNLGFALIPDEPRKALRHLNTAARNGYDEPFINAHNRMLCNMLIGAQKEALQIAEDTWSSFMTERVVPAILWSQEGNNWIAGSAPDARVAVADLAVEAALIVGGDVHSVWESRVRSLTGEIRDENR